MSRLEILIVWLSAFTSKSERERLALFFTDQEWIASGGAKTLLSETATPKARAAKQPPHR